MKRNPYNRLALMVGISLLPLIGGCASVPRSDCQHGCPEKPVTKSAKTLFTWAVGSEEKDETADKDKEKSGLLNGANTEAAEKDKETPSVANSTSENGGEADAPKPLETDRPNFTAASSTVGRGRIQLESGYTYTRDRADGSTTHFHSYPEMLFRIGMFADWFELRIGQNFGNQRNESPALIDTIAGADDLYLGVKLALTEQKKYLPESALILQTSVPTGHRDFTAEQLLPGVNYLFGWDVIDDCLSCGGSTQINRAFDDLSHYYMEFAQSFTVGYTLTKKLGAYTEWFAIMPTSAISNSVGPEHYFDGGFTYKVTDNVQLDIRAGVGLNRHADDFFIGSGFAVRY